MEDYLILDANELDSVADIIEQYSRRQIEIIDEYLSNICSLGTSWQDDQTFAPLYNEIVNLKRTVESKMEAADDCATRLRIKAEFIRQRPKIAVNGATSSYTSSTMSASSRVGAESATISGLTILSPERLNVKTLNAEMCAYDNVGKRNDYVRISDKPARIKDLDKYTFLSPYNGRPIEAKYIAWRSIKSVDESNSMNVCGAEFYYTDGDHSFCGSYVGKDWQEIYDNNFSETKKYR